MIIFENKYILVLGEVEDGAAPHLVLLKLRTAEEEDLLVRLSLTVLLAAWVWKL